MSWISLNICPSLEFDIVIQNIEVAKTWLFSYVDSIQSMHMKFNNGALENPRVTSFTDTHVQEPVVQIKQPIWLTQQARHKYIPNKNIAAVFTATKGKTRKHCESHKYY